MIHLSQSSGSFSVLQITGSFRRSRQTVTPFSLEPAYPGPYLFIFYFFVFLQMTLFPSFKPLPPVYMSAHLWTLSPWDDPSVTELRFFFSLTDHCIFLTIQKCYSWSCSISFSFITPFKLLPLLLVAQQHLIAICHSP